MSSGKIYRLIFPEGSYYIGSTFIDLKQRLYYHKCKAYTCNSPVYRKWREFGKHDVTIELLEEVTCNKIELEQKEDIYILACIDDEKCLNKKRALHDPISYDYAYRNANAEILAEKRSARRERLKEINPVSK